MPKSKLNKKRLLSVLRLMVPQIQLGSETSSKYNKASDGLGSHPKLTFGSMSIHTIRLDAPCSPDVSSTFPHLYTMNIHEWHICIMHFHAHNYKYFCTLHTLYTHRLYASACKSISLYMWVCPFTGSARQLQVQRQSQGTQRQGDDSNSTSKVINLETWRIIGVDYPLN